MAVQSVPEQLKKRIRILDRLKWQTMVLKYSKDLIQLNVIWKNFNCFSHTLWEQHNNSFGLAYAFKPYAVKTYFYLIADFTFKFRSSQLLVHCSDMFWQNYLLNSH